MSKRPKAAAAHRAARRDVSSTKGLTSEEHGIWGGLGPDREFLPLPPAPEGRVVYRSAKDTEVDIFAELCEGSVTATSEAPKSGEDEEPVSKPTQPTPTEPLPEPEDSELPAVTVPRPTWRVKGAPLFSGDPPLGFEDLGLSEAAVFEDAVGRLALSGFEITKCHLALEAAGGDENLARQFLLHPE